MINKPLTVRAVAELVGGVVEGNDSLEIAGIAPLDSAGPGELTFAVDDRHASRLTASKAGTAIVSTAMKSAPPKMTLIRVESVQAAVAALLGELALPEDVPPAGRHSSAIVADDAQVAEDAAIGPNVVIGPRADIGPRCVLCANVVIGAEVVLGQDVVLYEGVAIRQRCRLGSRVRIGTNSVIGYEGFGYDTVDGVHQRIPHIGNVVIEDDVEIGACSCVDRAKFGSTRIGPGTKIDNLVQIGHNVQIGRGCILAGQSGVAGSTKLGNYVVLGGNAGVRDNVTIGDGVRCAAYSGIGSDIADGETVAGIPAGPAREMFRVFKASAKLPELIKRVRNLEARLGKLDSAKDD